MTRNDDRFDSMDKLATKRAKFAIANRGVRLTIADAALGLGLDVPTCEDDLRRLKHVCNVWCVQTNCEDEPFWRNLWRNPRTNRPV